MTREQEITRRSEMLYYNICKIAGDKSKFKMSIPPQDDDTDMLACEVLEKDIPYLIDRIADLEKKIKEIKRTLGKHPSSHYVAMEHDLEEFLNE